jgi:hypothetical protein
MEIVMCLPPANKHRFSRTSLRLDRRNGTGRKGHRGGRLAPGSVGRCGRVWRPAILQRTLLHDYQARP